MRPRIKRALVISLALAAIASASVALYAWLGDVARPEAPGLAGELRDRGRIAVVGGADLAQMQAEGAQLVPAAQIDGLEPALDATDDEALLAVLRRGSVAGLLVDGRGPAPREPRTARERLRAYRRIRGLRGVRFAPTAGLYVLQRATDLDAAEGAVLARVARQLLGGSRPPQVSAFPEPLRRARNIEVMVLLRQGDRPLLWRSARGGSIARALMTAATVARERWAEREQLFGAPIERRLPMLAVEVHLLEEDGTLDGRGEAFLDRAITDEHGVALEHRQSWHYLLPAATRERGQGSATRAYRELFADAGLPPDSFDRDGVRLYRLLATRVGTSAPTAASTGSSAIDPFPEGMLAPSLDSL